MLQAMKQYPEQCSAGSGATSTRDGQFPDEDRQ